MLLQMDNNKKDNNYERNSKSTKGAFLTGFYKRNTEPVLADSVLYIYYSRKIFLII